MIINKVFRQIAVLFIISVLVVATTYSPSRAYSNGDMNNVFLSGISSGEMIDATPRLAVISSSDDTLPKFNIQSDQFDVQLMEFWLDADNEDIRINRISIKEEGNFINDSIRNIELVNAVDNKVIADSSNIYEDQINLNDIFIVRNGPNMHLLLRADIAATKNNTDFGSLLTFTINEIDAIGAFSSMRAEIKGLPIQGYVFATADIKCSGIYDPICGQPIMPICPAGMYCEQMIPAPRTYMNMCDLTDKGAEFLYKGICDSACTENDDGMDYYNKGKVYGCNGDGSDACNDMVELEDSCTNENGDFVYEGPELIESYCDGSSAMLDSYLCVNGCRDGACIADSNLHIDYFKADHGMNNDILGYKESFTVSWLANADHCSAYGNYVRVDGSDQNWTDFNNLAFRGSRQLIADHQNLGYQPYYDLGLQCFDSSGDSVEKMISIKIDPSKEDFNNIPPAGYEDDVVIINPADIENPFSDVDPSALEGQAAIYLYHNKIIGGFKNGEFRGWLSVDRAQATKFLLYAVRLSAGSIVDLGLQNNGRFRDMPEIDPRTGEKPWYTPFIIEAANRGIIVGYGNGYIGPNDMVTTEQFLKMMSLTFGLPQNLYHQYIDVAGRWSEPYAGIAYKYNLFFNKKDPTKLDPEHKLNRNEVAVAIYQYLKTIAQKS
ncbi:MAG: S-layer homology domain-containing protein [Patescibacteria group bacterium]|nr:S-layer homology domain-containing protein [Patescibacteria group bacterium]